MIGNKAINSMNPLHYIKNIEDWFI